jgi:hypothetical protein
MSPRFRSLKTSLKGVAHFGMRHGVSPFRTSSKAATKPTVVRVLGTDDEALLARAHLARAAEWR